MEFKRGVPWYEFIWSKQTNQQEKLPQNLISKEFDRAEKIYNEFVENQPIDEITANILENGTMKDRYASYKVLAQDHPLLMLEYLKKLNELMKGKPRLQVDSMACASQIYAKSLLPKKRPLKKFADQITRNASDRVLLLYYFEDRLKYYYAEFIKATERAARARQDFVRDPAIKTLGELMKEAPENELVILNILVDKFGDPLTSVSNVASIAIHNVLKDNPGMSPHVSKIIKQRMNSFSEPGKKRALNFIGQLQLQKDDKEAASELLATVREQLIPQLGRQKKEDSRVISSLMRSAERCAEICDPKELKELVDPLYIFIAAAPISTALPALRLLHKLHKAQGSIPDKFYQFFYAFFNQTDFGSSQKHPQVLNFLLDVLKEEDDPKIACNFLHRLLHIGLHMNVMFTVSVLYFCATLFKEKPAVKSMMQRIQPELELQYDFTSEAPNSEAATVTFPWILNLYTKHYHPAVVELAEKLASGKDIEYNGDPFHDFSATTQLNHISGKKIDDDEQELLSKSFKEFDQIPDFEEFENEEHEDEE